MRGSLLTGCHLAGRWPAPSGNILPHHHKINELNIALDLYGYPPGRRRAGGPAGPSALAGTRVGTGPP
ncbi:MAG TPA: hypothetical protein VKD72_38230 [Gemmataceae bacterium]|nr:hypothetical protein [Gemmataceae bacterium]